MERQKRKTKMKQKRIKHRIAYFMALLLGMLEIFGAPGTDRTFAAVEESEDSSLSEELQTAREEGHWLSGGETGEILFTEEMEAMYFSPEEDGAWTLSLRGSGYWDIAYTAMFLVYEWQEGRGWVQRDFISGPGIKSVGSGYFWKQNRNINGYYRKGVCYKIEFYPTPYEEGGQECTLSWSFQSTALAGESDGTDGSYVWRASYESYDLLHMDTETLDTEGMTVQIMQMPETSEVVIPETLDGYTVTECTNFYMQESETIETICLTGSCRFAFDFLKLPCLKSIYVNDMDASWMFGGMASSKVPENVMIYCRANSAMEYQCLESNWSYQLLEEPETSEPSESAMPGEKTSPATAAPTKAADEETSHAPAAPTKAADGEISPAPAAPTKVVDGEISPASAAPTKAADGEISPATAAPTKAADEETSHAPAAPTKAADGEISPAPAAPTKAEDGEISPAPAAPTKAADGETSPAPAAPTKAADGEESTVTAVPTEAADGEGETESEEEDDEEDSIVSEQETFSLTTVTDRYTYVVLKWQGDEEGRYEILRSADKGASQILDTVRGNKKKWTYRDDTVESGTTYYYRVVQKKKQNGVWNTVGQSKQFCVKIRQLQTPVISVVKKQTGKVYYFRVRLLQYEGDYVEIYYKKKKKGIYQRLLLKKNKLQKKNPVFRIRYTPGEDAIYLRLRTKKMIRKKQIWSRYSREWKIV